MMVYILTAQVAPESLKAWETSQNLHEMPSVEEVINFPGA